MNNMSNANSADNGQKFWEASSRRIWAQLDVCASQFLVSHYAMCLPAAELIQIFDSLTWNTSIFFDSLTWNTCIFFDSLMWNTLSGLKHGGENVFVMCTASCISLVLWITLSTTSATKCTNIDIFFSTRCFILNYQKRCSCFRLNYQKRCRCFRLNYQKNENSANSLK